MDTIIKNTQPLISVVMPSFNRAHYISQAIESVLSQTYSQWELIIIDDASTDTTALIVANFIKKDGRIRYIKNEVNSGISKSRNRGVAEARGEYIAMLDSDDVWLDAKKLEKQMDFFAHYPQHPEHTAFSPKPLGVLGTWIQKMDDLGNLAEKISFLSDDANIRKNILYKNPIAQSSAVLKTEIVKKAGGYDENIVTMDDHDLWLRMGLISDIAVLPEYTTGYRIHPGGITKKKKLKVATEELHIISKYKAQYPGFLFCTMKGLVRLALAWLH
jgi:glycosyltransferase involved in cell wall biosynthesis